MHSRHLRSYTKRPSSSNCPGRCQFSTSSKRDNYDQTPERKFNYHLNTIYGIKPGFSEILIHCAYATPGELAAPHATRREADTKAFMSADIKRALKEAKIQVVNWKDLRRMSKGG